MGEVSAQTQYEEYDNGSSLSPQVGRRIEFISSVMYHLHLLITEYSHKNHGHLLYNMKHATTVRLEDRFELYTYTRVRRDAQRNTKERGK